MKNIYTYFYISILQLFLFGIAFNSQAQCPTIANATYSSTDVTCAGANDGTVTVELGDGTAPFNYFLFDLNQGQFLLTATRTVGPANKVVFSNLHASDYIVQVRKVGCPNINIGGLGVPVLEPAPLVLDITSQTNIAGCFGENTGSVSVRASGGNGSYQYSFNGGAFGTTTTYTNLSAGTYPVQVKDAKDCTQEISIEITQPAQLAATISSQTNISCNGGSTGNIVVSASGGTPGYTYSINGAAFAAGTGTFSNLAAGDYTIRVRDSRSCEITLPTVTLTQPALLTIALSSKTDVTTCFGDATGEISVTAGGGTGPYSYSVNSGAFAPGTGAFSNLTAGTYTVVVRDANNCTATLAPVTVTQPTQVAISLVSKKDIENCFGEATGEIVVSASGGTAGYEYSVNGAAFTTGATFSNLQAGDYSIRVRDSRGCIATLPTVTLTQPAALAASMTAQTNPACFSNTNGSITVTASGGTPAYEYAVNNGAFAAGTGTFSNLGAGEYTVRVRDSKNCQVTLPTITLTQPALLAITLTSETDITTCFGDATGEIVATVNGGTAGYEFSVNGGTFAPGTGTFSNLTAGTYTIVVRDANGCTATLAPVTITQPTQLAISLTAKKDIEGCFGEDSGEIVVAVNGGTPGYEYSVNSGAFTAGTGTFPNLAAGTYTITVRDSQGCQISLAPVSITQPDVLTASIGSQTNISCNGGSTGNIVVSASGGTPGYTYSINGAAFAAGTGTFSNLAAGDYTIRVRDSRSCEITLPTVTLTQPALLTIALSSKTDVTTCFGDATGEISVTAGGGTGPYSYSVNSGAFAPGTGAFSNLTAGTYTVVVRDANNCTATLAPVTVTQPTQVAISLVSKKDIENCFGEATGEIVVSASGGTAGYEYSVNGAAFTTGATFSNLQAGDYSIRVRDSRGCIATLPTVTLTQPAALGIGLVNRTNGSCQEANDGSISVNATGGTPGYTYSINGAAFTSTATFTSLQAGTYTIQVRDANGCTATLPAQTITQPAQLAVVLVSKREADCNGANSGSITVGASGGTADYQYSINGGSFGSNAVFNDLSAGTYTIRVRDANGCTAQLAPQTITAPAALAISATSQTEPACNGESTGSITVDGIGGTAPYAYAINGGSYTNNNIFSGLAAGTYSFLVRDANNCTATVTGVILLQPAALTVTSNSTNVSCNGGNNGSITLAVSGGTAPYTYAVNGGASTPLTGAITNLTAGTYNISVRDSKGCTLALPAINITQPAALTLEVTSQANINICTGTNSGSVTVAASGGNSSYMYAIDGGAFGTTATFNNLTPGNYTVQVRDANNCTAQVSVTITTTTGTLTASADRTNPSCNGSSDGTITITNLSGGAGSYAYSMNGTTFQDSPVFANLSAGTYTITVRDKNTTSCTATVQVSLVDPVVLSATANSMSPSCGVNNGSITVTASGGTGPYTYAINNGNFSGSSTFSNLAAGSYDIIVRDANGCMAILDDVVLTQPAAITASLTGTAPSGCGVNDGSISIGSVSGGSSPYSYSLDGVNFVTSSVFSSLSEGSYTVYIRDNNGCQLIQTQTLTSTGGLTARVTPLSESECGANNGRILVSSVRGAAGPYNYFIDLDGSGVFIANPAGANSNRFSDLEGNKSYQIRVEAPNGCSYTSTIVTIPSPCTPVCNLTASVSGTQDVSCNGGSDGNLTVTVSGGNGNYEYSIDGTNYQSIATFSGLSAGDYTINIRDRSNTSCSTSVTATISQSDAILAVVTSTNPSGCTERDGTITIQSVGGGTSPYSYSLDNSTFQTTAAFASLPDGTYSVYIKDNVGCTVIQSVTLTSTTGIVASASKQDVTCSGARNGSITVSNVSNGSGSYEYSLDGTIFQNNTNFAGLAGGNYTITVRDITTTCTTTVSVAIIEPAVLAISLVNKTDVRACYGDATGEIIAAVSGGTSPYSYSVNGGSFTTGTGSFSNLTAGEYTIVVRDANDCRATLAPVTITEPAPLALSLVSTQDVSCSGETNGAITVSASGGTGAYSYSIDGTTFTSSAGFSNLAAGSYDIIVRDANGCMAILEDVVLTQPAAITASLTGTAPSGCGVNDGSISIGSVSGGSSPYSYSLDGVNYQSTSSFTALAAGAYVVYVKDAKDCILSLTENLSAPAAVRATVAVTEETACQANNGSITVSTSSGQAPFQYLIDGVLNPAGANSNIFSALAPASYSIRVVDANGCEYSLRDVVVTTSCTSTCTLAATAAVSNVVCATESNGSISVTATAGTAPYRYSIDGTNFVSTNTFSGLRAADYTITVRDAAGCQLTVIATVSQPQALAAVVEGVNPTSCTAADGSIRVSSVSGGNAAYSYSVDGVNFGTSSVFSNLSEGSYNIYIRDNNGCQISLTENLEVVSGITAVSISATAETACGVNDGTITVGTVTGAVGPYQYFIDGVLNPAGAGNNVFNGLAPKSYTIRVVAANGCTFSTNATVSSPCAPACTLTARIISSPVLCDGQSNGTAELIEVTGGSGRYEYSINGTSYQDTPNFGNLGAGTYTISVRDRNNPTCTASFTTTVTSQFRVSGIIVVTEPKTCNDKGSIEFTNISGGTAAYSFSVDGSTFSATMLYSGLDAGIYPTTIRDANNCRFSVAITVKGVEPITATVTQSAPVSCHGESDGKIKIENVKGGSGTYVYSLDGSTFSGTQEFTGLKGGDYTMYIKDLNGSCINTFKITVAEPANVVADLTTIQPSNCSVSDGEILVEVVSSGVAPFTYKLNNGTFQAENKFTALAGGEYTVTVRSANGCTARFTAILRVPNAVAAKVEAISAASCSGKEDGSARVFDVTGGSGVYEYSKDGLVYQATGLFTGLAAGTYVLYVRDKGIADGCTASYPVIVTEATQIIANVTQKDPATCISKDGEIIMGTISGGTAPYLYSLDNITYQNMTTFSGLDNGMYTVYVKDSKGCIAQLVRTLASPNAVTLGTPTILQPACKGGSDGELTMNNVANGIEPYQYSLDGITYQSSAKFTSLKAGKYTVRVKDATGCVYSFNYELVQPNGINYQITYLAASACGEPTGSVGITGISGGIAPYLFSIDGINFQSRPVFEKLTAGQYNLFIRDNTPSGCVVKDVFTVQGVKAITYKIDSVSIGCEGGNKGRIVVYELKGGNKPYQVSIDNGSTWQFVQDDQIPYNDLAPKSYQLIIKYGASCQTEVRNINIYSGGLPVGISTTAATCGAANGSATAIMSDASKKYFYSIDNNRFQESPCS
jgi:hypothetical protein